MAVLPEGVSWRKVTIWSVAAVAALALAVLLARFLISLSTVAAFIERYPGVATAPESSPVGLPGWLRWQHFLNMFFMIMIIRAGWLVRTTQRPKAFWTRDNTKFIKTAGEPTKISFNLWIHLAFDVFWVLNGVIFIILLFVTGQWMRVVPTNWDVFPNAVSVGLQYLSLDWPTEHSWAHYNALQLLTYFITIFIAAPLSLISGFRMSPSWSTRWTRAGKLLPLEVTRKIHVGVMVYYLLFIVVHVTLVMATGALRNLNHMYTGTDDVSWTGFWYFAASMVVVVIGWVLARPMFLQPIASIGGKVTAR